MRPPVPPRYAKERRAFTPIRSERSANSIMLFVISKLSEIGADPGNVLAALLVIGVVLLWRGRARAGRRFVTAVAVAFVVVAILPLGSWAIAPFEARFPRVHLPPQIYGIILLGGAIDVAN